MPIVLAVAVLALLVFVALLAARLRAAAGTIAELRAGRERDRAALAAAREEAARLVASGDELARARAALADAQAALADVRAERDGAREGAAELARQRKAFLGALAHDLRNPLAPLSNGIELLRLTDADPAGRVRTRGIMERQVGHLMRIADELSELARLSGDAPVLQSAPFDLAALVAGLAEQLHATLQAQEATLVADPSLAALPPLRGDGPRLAQAFGHLVADLVRHSERGSTIRVTATPAGEGRIGLRLATEAGAGSDAPPLADVETEEVDTAALGLGVSLAAQLVALHGGRLGARRPAGARRASFVATLPVQPGVAAVPAPPTLPTAQGPALAVLLADDNVDFSHSFGTMLELLGHRVAVVHDGPQAVASIVASPPDIAFVDIGMPSLDGVEAVRRVRGQGNTHDVLLVAVTGRGGAEDRARAAEAGFDRYLVKPFAMQDVRDALDAAQAIRAGSTVRAAGAFAPSRAS